MEPRHDHWITKKHILRYLHGIVDYGLRYVSKGDVQMLGDTNSNWEGSAEDRKIKFRGCFSLGFSMISWINRKQTFVALNVVEADYIAYSLLNYEAVWI